METNVLKDWEIKKIREGVVVMFGYIYNDIKGRFDDGTFIHTSRVLKIDFVNGICETENSVYHFDYKEE